MSRADLGRLIEDERANAVLAWVLIGIVVLVAVGSLVRGDLLWAIFAAAVAVVAVFPPLAFGSSRAMIPWEVLVVAAFPTVGYALVPPVLDDVATYLAVAALALVLAVELHLFTSVTMSYRFAVVFVVMATMATAGIWAVVRWVADGALGTGFLTSDTRLMWEFIASMVAGLGAGIFFEGYVRRRVRIERFPEEIR